MPYSPEQLFSICWCILSSYYVNCDLLSDSIFILYPLLYLSWYVKCNLSSACICVWCSWYSFNVMLCYIYIFLFIYVFVCVGIVCVGVFYIFRSHIQLFVTLFILCITRWQWVWVHCLPMVFVDIRRVPPSSKNSSLRFDTNNLMFLFRCPCVMLQFINCWCSTNFMIFGVSNIK